MSFKTLFLIFFVTACSGGPTQHLKAKSNKATYSQSFVREDVPMSYKYSAIHYYKPNNHEKSSERNQIRKFSNLTVTPVTNKSIQFAPIPLNPNEHTHPTAPSSALYTSIRSNPASQYEKYELTENTAEPVLKNENLEPKLVPINGKYVYPSTYRPHMNHDVKIFHSAHIRPNSYGNPNTHTVTTTDVGSKIQMDGHLHQANIFEHFQQQLVQQTEHILSTTTESPKFSRVLNLGVSIIPKPGTPVITVPHEIYSSAPFQPIPRMAYHNKFNAIPETQGRRQMHSHYNHVHLNKPKTH